MQNTYMGWGITTISLAHDELNLDNCFHYGSSPEKSLVSSLKTTTEIVKSGGEQLNSKP